MMLGNADPVKAELFDKSHAVDHAMKRPCADFGVVRGGRYRPLARNVRRYITACFEIRNLHDATREATCGPYLLLALDVPAREFWDVCLGVVEFFDGHSRDGGQYERGRQ